MTMMRGNRRGTGLMISFLACAGMSGAPAALTGLWEFSDSTRPGKATVGADLDIAGAPPAFAASSADAQAAPVTLQGVITTVAGRANHFIATHRIGANGGGGGTRTNQYTLLFDVRRPATTAWRSLYQTDLENGSDAQYFVRTESNTLGRASITYSSGVMAASRWYRLAIAVDLEAGSYLTYLDGVLLHTHTAPPADGEFSLDPDQVLLLADNDNENQPLSLGLIAIYSSALTASQISVLGTAGSPVPHETVNNPPPSVTAPAAAGPAATTTGTVTDYAFTATDPEGTAVQVQADWGDGTLSPWSALAASGQPAALSHVWAAAGSFTLKARARDAGGAVSPWVEIQSITVTGPPVVTIVTPPYLQNARTTGMVVMCEIKENLPVSLHYGTTPAYGKEAVFTSEASGGGTRFYRAVLTDLTPGTVYHYRLATSPADAITSDATFRTPPEGREDFRFSLWADSQGTNHGAWEADPLEPTVSMMKHMAARGVAFGVNSGDLAENGDSYSDTRDFYLSRVARHLGTKAPWFNAWGNHDSGNASAVIRRASDMPSRYRAGFSPGHGSFSFSWSGVFFVCLDYYYQEEITSGWVEAELASPASKAARFRVVCNHVPPFCELWIDGDATLRSRLVPLLEKYDVHLMVSGHTHEYERGSLNDVNYLITGGGSWLDFPETVVRDWPHMTAGGAQDFPGKWAEQSSRGVLGSPGNIRSGLFNEYLLATVRGRYLRIDVQGFNADGSYIGVMDTLEIGTDPGPDSDGDGLRDPWETQNGLDPQSATGSQGAGGDPDGDGQTNAAEYLAGTAPTNPASRFQIRSLTGGAPDFQITWQSVPGKNYRLEQSPNLRSWSPVTHPGGALRIIPASLDATTAAAVAIPVPGFLRVAVIPPEE
ncbi:MAG: metallophosphoesterase [Verrucomicrobiota bacterium]